MKFFTRSWAFGDNGSAVGDNVAAEYQRHLSTLDLPAGVSELARLNPHDGYLLEVEHDAAGGRLFVAVRCGDLGTGYFDAALRFSHVVVGDDVVTMLKGAIGRGTSEILYDEVDRMGAAVFAYRLLMHPEGEVELRFGEVRVERRSVVGRDAR